MKRIFTMLALFVALGAGTASAQYNARDRDVRWDEPGVYQDDRGEYHWQTVERRVWIPERRTYGIFGIGGRTIPGHYEIRQDRVKIYDRSDRNNRYDQNGQNKRGWAGKHPHGMPPGQRKKMERERDDRYDDRDDRDDRRRKDKRYRDRDDD